MLARVIDLDASTTDVLLNPRLAEPVRRRLFRTAAALPPLEAHVWLATSGTTGAPKLVALAKRAVLAAAEAANAHLEARSGDVWLHALPAFHVGGLGIFARARLSGARVVAAHDGAGFPPPWRAADFARRVRRARATLASLVPTQVHDLVAAAIRCPPSLRAVVVGGAALDPALFARARELGWPLLPSYGATETASQVATAPLASLEGSAFPDLVPLPHATFRTTAGGRLAVRASSLLTGYAVALDLDDEDRVRLVDPKVDGFWASGDRGRVAANGAVVVEGREDDAVKVGGELVSLARLRDVAARIARPGAASVVAVPDPRLGHALELLVETGTDPEAAREAFNAAVAPFERARTARAVARGTLGAGWKATIP